MLLQLIVFIERFVITDGSKCCSTDPKKPSNNCEQTTLAAKGFIQAVITPGYPNGLPEYRQCTWT